MQALLVVTACHPSLVYRQGGVGSGVSLVDQLGARLVPGQEAAGGGAVTEAGRASSR